MNDIDKLVRSYVACRDDLSRETKIYNALKKEHKLDMQIISDHIMELADDQNVNSFATPHGTAYRMYKDFIQVENWGMALDFIIQEDLLHLLTKSVGKAAAKEYMELNEGNLPPGLKYGKIPEIGVRRK